MEEQQPRISVVVPTRDRPELLQRCLAALEKQTIPVEVVVVEDAEGRGPAWARNEGVRRSRGEVICFTDDDCAPFPGWAKALSTPILEGEAQATAGPTHMASGATAADLAWEAIVSYLQEQATKPGTASPGFAATANLAAIRSLLEKLPFDESFPMAAGEDRDWADRATRQSARPLFVPGGVVIHKSGLGRRDFLRQQYRYGKGAARYRSAGDGRGFGSMPFYAGLLRHGFAAGSSPGALVCAAQAATLLGIAVARALRSAGRVRGTGVVWMTALLVLATLSACGGSEQSERAEDAGRGKQGGSREAKSFALAREVCEEGPKSDFARDSVGLPADATDVEIARGYASQWGEKDRKAAFRGCLDGLARPPARFPPSSPAARALWDRSFVLTSVGADEEGEDPPVARPPRIRFWFSSERDHSVSWKARCNGYGADARITARRIQVSEVGSTLIGCPAAQSREDAWLARFMEAMPEWRLEGERLRLSTDYATLRLRG